MRRYRCRSAGCAWEGLLARSHRMLPRARRAVRAEALEQAARTRASRVATALLVVLSVAVAGAIFWVRQVPVPLFGFGADLPIAGRQSGKPTPAAAADAPPANTARLE